MEVDHWLFDGLHIAPISSLYDRIIEGSIWNSRRVDSGVAVFLFLRFLPFQNRMNLDLSGMPKRCLFRIRVIIGVTVSQSTIRIPIGITHAIIRYA